ncbi:MAG: nucleotidyl transferase AbiEii/AbiGii toxin family protein [Minicystis sp.]
MLKQIGPAVTARGFYLGGGTALALRLGHRISVDLDWFSEASFGDPALLAAALRQAGVPFQTTMMAEGTLHGTVHDVEVSFLHYPYPRLRPLGRAREFRIASLDDLTSMKLSAVVNRGTKKDFVDIWALCREHRPLDALIDLYQRRYGVEDRGHVLTALCYFADAARTRMPRMLWDVSWATVERQIEGWVVEATRRS